MGPTAEGNALRATGTDDVAPVAENVLPAGLPENDAQQCTSTHLNASERGSIALPIAGAKEAENPEKSEAFPGPCALL